jgi:photosystem II stability/assembly factor-like uncharacterized protein
MADKTLMFAGAEAHGLYRKATGDTRWEELSEGLPPQPQARPIAIHPDRPDVVFVGTQRGVYRSQDRGDHWQRMNLPEGRVVWSLAFHPHNAQMMYLGTEGSEVYTSQDGGEHWDYLSTIVNPDAVQMAFSTRILGFALESGNPQNMFAALEVGGAARSHDGGKTWDLVNRDLAGNVDLMDLHGVTVGAADCSAVFIANRVGVLRSHDRGDTWENLHLERFSPIAYSRGVQTAPHDPSTLYACVGLNFASASGGVVRSTDLGVSWERIDHGVSPNSTTFGVAINRQNPEQICFCTRKGQVFSTPDNGASWQEHMLPDSAMNVISVACTSV